MPVKKIGLLLGTETCWPRAYEEMMRRLDLKIPSPEGPVTFEVFRCDIEPFDIRYRPRHHLVIDRLTHWFLMARAWLKKVALMDGVYLLNNPFTFQSMEKHSAYCAMIRLGLHVPPTWVIPQKAYEAEKIFEEVTRKYNKLFDLDAIAEGLGYPLYMKPFDGGGWVGVSRVGDRGELHRAYDSSGTRIMHLQKAVEPYDVFVRALAVGPQVLPMRYAPERPLHERYVIAHGFLSPEHGREIVAITKTINAFFRWEYNSCEAILKDGIFHPVDYANACPDSSLTSLHFYFPWVVKALIRWTVFCAATGRKMRIELDMGRYFEIGDRTDLSYEQKLRAYERLADEYFDTERFEAFCSEYLSDLDERFLEFSRDPVFDDILVETVRLKFPLHEHDRIIAHYRGLINHWRHCEEDRLAARRSG
jgi:hypothetical protein